MSAQEDRTRCRIGGIDLRFPFPLLESDGEGEAVKHHVLPTDEAQNEDTAVIQPLGRTPHSFTLRGDCYEDEASRLDALSGDVVHLRHFRHTGDVYVDSVTTEPTEAEDSTGRRYTYRMNLTEVS